MLYLTRRIGEAVIINNEIEVRVVEIKGKVVKLGFTFPENASVLREEVLMAIKAENQASLANPDALVDIADNVVAPQGRTELSKD